VLHIGLLSSEDLKERVDVLVSTFIVACSNTNRWSELLKGVCCDALVQLLLTKNRREELQEENRDSLAALP
jgi:hypothetical protein